MRVAETGRLKMDVPDAARLMHAGGRGVVFSLIGEPDARLSESMREAVLAAILDDAPKPTRSTKRVAPRAIALRAVLPEATALSDAERVLLDEWLERLARE